MVTTIKTWYDDINNIFSSASQPQHYREAFFYLKQTYLSANWTVTLSCDSINAPSASDQILTPANVVWGNAAQARSWIVLRSPVGWCSSQIEVLLGADNSNASATPTTYTVRSATSAYSGGSVTTYPTAPTGFQTNSGTNLLFHTANLYAQWSAWWTADGDVYFGVKPIGTTFSFTTFHVSRSDGGFVDGGRGAFRAMNWVATASSTNALQFSAINNNWRAWRTTGAVLAGTPNMITTPANVLTYRYSRNTANSVTPGLPIYFCNAVAGAEARFYGRWLDVLAVPIGNPANFAGEVRDNEGTDAKRYVSIGTLYLPTSPASLVQADNYGNVLL